MGILTHFPVPDQSIEFVPEHPSAQLSARVAVGVSKATAVMCSRVLDIAHADHKAKKVAMLVLLEVVGRAASDPNVTVTQLLEALYEQVPEDVATGGVA